MGRRIGDERRGARETLGGVALAVALLAAGYALAFDWNPDTFPTGDHSYTWEIASQGDNGPEIATMTVDIRQQGDSYATTTTLSVTQSGIAHDELSGAALGGSMMGMLGFGPMMMFYGPAFMILPMMLGNEDIHVRQEPIRVMGMGSLVMDHSETVAGHECVVISFRPDDDSTAPMEFALAEDLPFPCFSSYGEDTDKVSVRLVNAE